MRKVITEMKLHHCLPGSGARGQDTPAGYVASLLQFLVFISPLAEMRVKELGAAVLCGVMTHTSRVAP